MLCVNNGIVMNEPKLQFCQDEVELAGLNVTSYVVKIPRDITKACSWFGLVNEVSWTYASSPIMEPFRNLIRQNQTFYWNDNLKKYFQCIKAIWSEFMHTLCATKCIVQQERNLIDWPHWYTIYILWCVIRELGWIEREIHSYSV